MNPIGPDPNRVPAPARPAAPAPAPEAGQLARESREAGVEFRWERRFRLPWMEETPPIEPDKAVKILEKNKPAKVARLRVVPPDAKLQLPLRSEEDLRELAVFARKQPSALLPHAELGDALQGLADRGWRFDLRQGHYDKVEAGLYGAYNALTDPAHGLPPLEARHPGLGVTIPLADEAKARDLADFHANPAARSPQAATLVALEDDGYRLAQKDRTATCAFLSWSHPEDVWIGRGGDLWMPLASLDLSDPGRVPSSGARPAEPADRCAPSARVVLEQVGRLVEFTGAPDRAREAWQLLQRPVSGLSYDQRQALLFRLGKAEGSNREAVATYDMLLDGLPPRQSLEDQVASYEAMRSAMGSGGTPALARDLWKKLRPLGLDPAAMKDEAAAAGRWAGNRTVGARAMEVWEALREDVPDALAMREQLFKKLLEAEKGNDAQLTDALAGYRLARELRAGTETVTEVGDLLLKALARTGPKGTEAAHRALRVARQGPPGRSAAQVEGDLDAAATLFAALSPMDRAEALWALLNEPVRGEGLQKRLDTFLLLQKAEKGENATADAERCYRTLRAHLLPGEDLAAAGQSLAALLKQAGEPDDERTRDVLQAWRTLRTGATDLKDLESRLKCFQGWAKSVGVLGSLAILQAVGDLRPDIPLGDRLALLEELAAAEKDSRGPLSDALSNLDLALSTGGSPDTARQVLSLMKRWGSRYTKDTQAAMGRILHRASGDAEHQAALARVAAGSPNLSSFVQALGHLDALPPAERKAGAAVYGRLLAAEARSSNGYADRYAPEDFALARSVAPRMGGLEASGEALARLVEAAGTSKGREALKSLADLQTADPTGNAALLALFEAGAREPKKVLDGLADGDERAALVKLLEGRRFRYPGFDENWKDFETVRQHRVAGQALAREAERLVDVHQALAAGKLKGDARDTHVWLRQRLAEGALGDHVGIEHAHTALTRALLAGRPLEEARKALLEGAALKVVEEEQSVTVGGVTLPRRQDEVPALFWL